jgi:tRNA A58 N-methylase Trm61
MTRDHPTYVLGHSDSELARLERQAALFAPITREVLLRAGLGSGSRVLDLGCGAGDVSFLAAQIVGPTGRVVGVDRAPEAIAAARRRAATRGLTQVRFLETPLDALESEEVDAVIGRFVLMHQPDPAATLAHASKCVRRGGAVVMVESHLEGLTPAWQSWPASAAYAQVIDLMRRTITAAGGRTDMGLRLRSTFLDAGLGEPELAAHAVLAGDTIPALCRYWADSLRSVAPVAARLGIAGISEADASRWEGAMQRELSAPGAVMAAPLVITAWCTRP